MHLLLRSVGRSGWAPLLLLFVYACGSDDGAASSESAGCPPGVICGEGASGAQGGPSGPGSGAGDPGSGGSGGCVERWVCTPWDGMGTDDGVRTCVDEAACGTTNDKPVEAATLPPLDLNFYKCGVDPIMNKKCSQQACHGTEEGRALRLYHRGRLRNAAESVIEPGCSSPGKMVSLLDCVGSIECACFTVGKTATEWQRNFDSARGMLLDAQGNAAPDPHQSEMIQQPIVGGKAHAGVHLFAEDDADHQTIVQWLGGATLAACQTNN